jgi:hypothetical protein
MVFPLSEWHAFGGADRTTRSLGQPDFRARHCRDAALGTYSGEVRRAGDREAQRRGFESEGFESGERCPSKSPGKSLPFSVFAAKTA